MKKPAPSRQTPQLNQLTGIRGLAAWFVVLFHIRWLFYPIWPRWLLAAADKGYLAVDLFFMLSGFVMWLNYAGRLKSGGWSETARFWWRRIARIWPLHLLVLAGFVALASIDALRGHGIHAAPLSQLPLNIMLMQNWGFTGSLTWNVPAWSISTELAAYLLFPLVVIYPWERVSLPGLAAIIVLLLLGLHLLYTTSGEPGLGADIARNGLRRCLIEFALGNAMCLLWQRAAHLPERWRTRACWLAGATCAGCVAAGKWLEWPETGFVPAAFFCGLLGLALSRGLTARALGARLPRHLGEISYSTYMSHFLLYIVFKALFISKAAPHPGWPALIAYLALVLLASELLHALVELPAQRWLNRRAPMLERRFAKPVPE